MNTLIRRMVLATTIAVLSTLVFATTVVFSANPGTDQDPLVTLSFVEKRLDETVKSLSAQIADLKSRVDGLQGSASSGSSAGSTSGTSAGAMVFTMVQAEKGQFVYFGNSAEFIVRGGKVTVIATASGGLADLTGGKDLAMNQVVPANHHILVPKDDGRGLVVLEKTWLLVKGPYTVTK